MNDSTNGRAAPPFKADVVGSLLRPDVIHEARAKQARGEISPSEVWDLQTRCIEDAVALQQAVGLQVCTDGEFHRRHWFLDFIEKIDGVSIVGGLPTKFHNEQGDIEFAPPRVEVAASLKRSQSLVGRRLHRLKPIADRAGLMPKQPIPSPTLLHFRGGRAAIDKAAYPDMDEFFADLAQVYREEIAALYDAGCRYVQIDETNLPFLCDPALRRITRGASARPGRLVETYVALLNDCLRDVPADMTVVHAHVPRQSCQFLGRRRRLRSDRRTGVQRHQHPRLLPRIRYSARRLFRAVALSRQGQDRCARPGDDQEGEIGDRRTN